MYMYTNIFPLLWMVFSIFHRVYIRRYQAIGLMSSEFSNGPEERSSVPGQVIPDSKNGT